MSSTKIRFLNVFALICTLVLNALASTGALNGLDTGAISDRFDNKIVPAGFTFAIWGLIYPLLLAFAVYQALPRDGAIASAKAIGPWFVLSCVFNNAWLLCWHYGFFGPSMIMMLLLLGTLIVCFARTRNPRSPGERWCAQLPFSVYLGWITVATVVNFAVVLISAGWAGFGLPSATWAAIMIAVACVVAALVGMVNRDTAYLLVLVWAFFGIASRHANIATISTAASIGLVLMAVLAAWQVVRARQPQ